jgi:hypothetical protein
MYLTLLAICHSSLGMLPTLTLFISDPPTPKQDNNLYLLCVLHRYKARLELMQYVFFLKCQYMFFLNGSTCLYIHIKLLHRYKALS